MIVELSKAKVTIKDELTWGDSEKIQSALMKSTKIGGAGELANFEIDTDAMLEAKYVALSLLVIEIEEGEETKKWTREWQDGLSKKDGDLLYSKVDELSKN